MSVGQHSYAPNRGTCLIFSLVERAETEEPYAGILHVWVFGIEPLGNRCFYPENKFFALRAPEITGVLVLGFGFAQYTQ